MSKNFGQMAKVNYLQILPANVHKVSSIGLKYDDRHAEILKYWVPYNQHSTMFLCSLLQPNLSKLIWKKKDNILVNRVGVKFSSWPRGLTLNWRIEAHNPWARKTSHYRGPGVQLAMYSFLGALI